MKEYSILIIEDHALTRYGLKIAFEVNQGNSSEVQYTVFEAANAKKGLEIADNEKIDAVIMDLGLPDMNGIEATEIIKKNHPNTKIIILSSHEDKSDVMKSVKAGASAYCTKDTNQDELVYIVNAVLSGAAWFDPKIADYILDAAKSQSLAVENEISKPQNTEEIPVLTSREKQVLALIVDGMSNNEISDSLNISVNTAKAHVCKILQKLGAADRTQAAVKACKNNLI